MGEKSRGKERKGGPGEKLKKNNGKTRTYIWKP